MKNCILCHTKRGPAGQNEPPLPIADLSSCWGLLFYGYGFGNRASLDDTTGLGDAVFRYPHTNMCHGFFTPNPCLKASHTPNVRDACGWRASCQRRSWLFCRSGCLQALLRRRSTCRHNVWPSLSPPSVVTNTCAAQSVRATYDTTPNIIQNQISFPETRYMLYTDTCHD